MLPQLGVRGIVVLDRRGIRRIFCTRRRGEELGEQEGRGGTGICGHVGRGSLRRATGQGLQDASGAHSRRHREMSWCGRNGWTREIKCEVRGPFFDPTTATKGRGNEEARGSERKQEEARGSKRKREEARGSERKREEARGSERKREEARGCERKNTLVSSDRAQRGE